MSDPYLYRHPKATDEALPVHGEVWEISPATLRQLDQLEGHPDWYRRESIQVQMNSEAPMEVQAYLRPAPRRTLTGQLRAGVSSFFLCSREVAAYGWEEFYARSTRSTGAAAGSLARSCYRP